MESCQVRHSGVVRTVQFVRNHQQQRAGTAFKWPNTISPLPKPPGTWPTETVLATENTVPITAYRVYPGSVRSFTDTDREEILRCERADHTSQTFILINAGLPHVSQRATVDRHQPCPFAFQNPTCERTSILLSALGMPYSSKLYRRLVPWLSRTLDLLSCFNRFLSCDCLFG